MLLVSQKTFKMVAFVCLDIYAEISGLRFQHVKDAKLRINFSLELRI
jgi:hypothetical protein